MSTLLTFKIVCDKYSMAASLDTSCVSEEVGLHAGAAQTSVRNVITTGWPTLSLTVNMSHPVSKLD